MYASHNILDFNIICIFDFAFNRTVTSFCLLFFFIKTHILNIIYIVLIDFRINVLLCFSFSTYFIILLKDYLIHCMINKIIVLFLSVKFIYICGIIPTVLSRNSFRILISKVSQDLALIWWMTSFMDKTSVFGSILWMIYIPSSALSRVLTHLGVTIWQGGFSSHFPAVTSMDVILPSRFFISNFYNTFINRFWYFRAFKYVYSCFKSNGLTIKPLNTFLIDPDIRHYV